jgi:hypothetical protein
MRKKKEKAKRSCNQCGENMEHSAEVVSNGYVTMLVPPGFLLIGLFRKIMKD